jgi:hypothetical protein
LTLSGTAHVATNQGTWDIPYRRTFRIETKGGQGVTLTPLPEKNRFGMLGWPNAYTFVTPLPQPPFANNAVPADEGKLLALMDALLQTKSGTDQVK